MTRIFAIARDERENGAELRCTPNADATLLETEGNAFGLWPLENGSTPFLRGLQEVLQEAEIDTKGRLRLLGYSVCPLPFSRLAPSKTP